MDFGHQILQWNMDNMFTSFAGQLISGGLLDGHSQTAHLISILNKVPLYKRCPLNLINSPLKFDFSRITRILMEAYAIQMMTTLEPKLIL
jgi:hypothetical protein